MSCHSTSLPQCHMHIDAFCSLTAKCLHTNCMVLRMSSCSTSANMCIYLYNITHIFVFPARMYKVDGQQEQAEVCVLYL